MQPPWICPSVDERDPSAAGSSGGCGLVCAMELEQDALRGVLLHVVQLGKGRDEKQAGGWGETFVKTEHRADACSSLVWCS